MLALDHVFCMVSPDDTWAAEFEAAGWVLDAGSSHPGQGTRNRRLLWRDQFLELLWVEDEDAARRNPLRLDRRGRWRTSGASPFGFGYRGYLPERLREDYWLYDRLGFPIWIHHDSDRAPQRPLVFVLHDADQRGAEPGGRAPPRRVSSTPDEASQLIALRHTGPAAPHLPHIDG